MKCLRTLLGGAGLIFALGASAQAAGGSHLSATLFTARLTGDQFICSAVNVSDHTLGIAFALLDNNG